jgi:hypothetical protein
MSIHGEVALTRPDDMEATLTMTMTIKEWRSITAAVGTQGTPNWYMTALIRKIIDRAETSFNEKIEMGS